MSLHLNLLDTDHPLTFEESKLRQIEAHALIYLSSEAKFNEKGQNLDSDSKKGKQNYKQSKDVQ